MNSAGVTDLGTTVSDTNVVVTSSTGADATIAGATTTDAGVMTAADKTKLNGIAAGATVNQADSYLLNRANHTGSQAIASVTGLQTALDGKLDESRLGVADGIASLDGSGRVPSNQLPSYVDDILEFANEAAFPATGATGVLYVALDTNRLHRWSGTGYVEVSAGSSNLTMGGDITGTTSNAQIAGGAVGAAELADNAVTSAKIADGTIVEADLNTSVSSRLTDDIRNQYTAAQAASYWIDGKARVEDQTTLGGKTVQPQVVVRGAATQSVTTPLIQLESNTGTELARISTDGSSLGIGSNVLRNISTGTGNLAFGTNTLQNISTGSNNTAIGANALRWVYGGVSNIAIGSSAGMDVTSGGHNVAIGDQALFKTASGTGSVAIGRFGGYRNVGGTYNTFLGYSAGYNDSSNTSFASLPAMAQSTAIGTYSQVTQNNSLVLGSVDLRTQVGIGITSPQNLLSVSPAESNNIAYTATQSGSTVSATQPSFSSGMVGQTLVWADDGSRTTITGFTDTTHVTVDTTVTKSNATNFRTHYAGLQVTSTGRVSIGKTAPDSGYALDVNGTLNATEVQANGVSLGWVAAPASATANGVQGQRAHDANYLYICVATNTWRRVALSAW